MGLSVEEICKGTGLTPTNCSVILHRVRMRLRIHLAMCKSCARVEGQLLLLRKAMSELPKWRRDS
jgi:hypothetical protein